MRLLRRDLIWAGIAAVGLTAITITGKATAAKQTTTIVGENEVVHLAGPTVVTVGNSFNATVQVNQVPMQVKIKSAPAGLADKTVTQTSLTQTHSVETSGSATPANYTITATPLGSTLGPSIGIAAEPSASNQRRK